MGETEDRDSVLLADRARDFRELLARYLRALGLRVECVPSSQVARKRLDAWSPGCVILEAEDGGLELLREISGWPDPRPRVVVTTASPDLAEETRVSLDGGIGYLGKPLRLAELVEALGVEVHRPGTRRGPQRPGGG